MPFSAGSLALPRRALCPISPGVAFHYAQRKSQQGGTMKPTQERTMRRTLGLVCLLTTSLVFGLAVARADVVLDWNAIAVDTFNANGANPFAQARYGAIVQLAVFEAVNSITGEYHPYLGIINAPQGASAEAAAIQAAYDVLINYFPNS